MNPAIYHITHINNLPLILESGGLLPCSLLIEADYINIAHQSIQGRRATFNVPLAPFGTLHDYVPFYFAPRSPMLYAIHRGYVEGYSGGQSEIIYLTSTFEKTRFARLPFVFTDGHAVMALSEYFCDQNDLDKIDWEIMTERYWNDTIDDNDRKRRRQAEFLVHGFYPFQILSSITVYNKSMAVLVEELIENSQFDINIYINREWYY